MFRVENAEHKGPYSSGWNYDRDRHNNDEHPGPWRDGDLRKIIHTKWNGCLHQDYYCCFESMEKLRKCFSDEELVGLMQSGYTIVKYSTQSYFHGEYQSIFKKKLAKLLEVEEVKL